MFTRFFQLLVRLALINADIDRTVRDEKNDVPFVGYFVFQDNADNV